MRLAGPSLFGVIRLVLIDRTGDSAWPWCRMWVSIIVTAGIRRGPGHSGGELSTSGRVEAVSGSRQALCDRGQEPLLTCYATAPQVLGIGSQQLILFHKGCSAIAVSARSVGATATCRGGTGVAAGHSKVSINVVRRRDSRFD